MVAQGGNHSHTSNPATRAESPGLRQVMLLHHEGGGIYYSNRRGLSHRTGLAAERLPRVRLSEVVREEDAVGCGEVDK